MEDAEGANEKSQEGERMSPALPVITRLTQDERGLALLGTCVKWSRQDIVLGMSYRGAIDAALGCGAVGSLNRTVLIQNASTGLGRIRLARDNDERMAQFRPRHRDVVAGFLRRAIVGAGDS